MASPVLMAVFAHPDDEGSVAGVLAKASAEGHLVVLACATRGEAGEIADPALATHATLGSVREKELRDACRHLGVNELAFLDYRDGTLKDVDDVEAVGKVVRLVRRFRADVLLTFDPYGGYGHPDHIAANRWTTQAFELAGNAEAYPEHLRDGLRPHAPSKLYYRAFPASAIAALKDRMAGATITLNGVEMPIKGTPDEHISTEIDVRDFVDQKWRAFEAHQTQKNSRGPFSALTEDDYRKLMGQEFLSLARSTLSRPEGRETDVFVGLE